MGSVIERKDDQEYIRDEADTFHIKGDAASPDMSALTIQDTDSGDAKDSSDGTVDYNQILKVIIPYEDGFPTTTATPKFSHERYYSSLKRYQLLEGGAREWEWGKVLMYGEVVTSTNTLLEKLVPYNNQYRCLSLTK